MTIPYITFNGVSSISKGLRLVETEPFILPRRERQHETIPGRIGGIASESFDMPAAGYRLRLAAAGADKADLVSLFHSVAAWVLAARTLTVWHEPAYYFTGAVEGDSDFSMLNRRHGTLELTFLCDPPCRQLAKVSAAAFIPSMDTPIPEQLTDTVKTVGAANKVAAFNLDAGTIGGALPPALHLALTGTWTTLLIGGTLTITEAFGSSGTLYIDGDNQEVYKLVSAVRTPVSYSGDFPALTAGKLAVDGTDFSLSVARLLVIERG